MAAFAALTVWRTLVARMETVARACHELRGPITGALLGLQLVIREGQLSSATERAIDLDLQRAALALDDLAAVRGKRRLTRAREEIDLELLLEDSVEAWRAGAVEHGVQLLLAAAHEPARVWGDRLRLAQAICNLIANAVEHGGGEVEVRSRTDSSGVRVEVLDTGPGLPAPVAELAQRAHHGRGSRGRGLAIAAAIAEDHGGRLAAAPSQRGARLVLELPRSGPHETARGHTTSS